MPRDTLLILTASTLRSFAVGALSVFFGLYLALLGLTEIQIGVVIAAGLAGMAAGTLVTGLVADRLGRRKSFLAIALLMAAGSIWLATAQTILPLLLASFVGMVNAMGRERGPAQAIDQAVLAQSSVPEKRTSTFSGYTFLMDVGSAGGALVAGIPHSTESYRWAILLYAAIVLVSALPALIMSTSVEAKAQETRVVLSPQSKRLVRNFAMISVLDSLGGGFITRSLLSYWFIKRFGVATEWIGTLFAASSLVNSVSYFVAAWLAKKIGLINTMFVTHLPSSIVLVFVPFAPNFPVAAGLFFLREFLSPMDVPTRQSYLSAVVAEHERTAAASIVNLARNASWVAGPTLAGWAMTFSLSAPLFLTSTFKIIYDFVLWNSFRHIKPPEERQDQSSARR